MTHNSVTSSALELPPQVVEMPPTPPPAPAETGEGQYTRRAALRLVGRTIAVAGAGKLVLDANAPVAAEAQPETDPIDPTDPSEPLTPEDRQKLLEAQVKELIASANLKKAQREELEKGPAPTPLAKQVGDIATQVVTGVGILGGLGGGWVLIRRYFSGKKEERRTAAKTLRMREEALLQREEENFNAATAEIRREVARVEAIETDPTTAQTAGYMSLGLAYSQLRMFAGKEHFAPHIFVNTVTLLRGRAKTVDRYPADQPETGKLSADQVEARLNADRELVELLSMVTPNMPPDDELPNAAGISLTCMRQLRLPLERLNLTGAYMQDLLLTDSLVGSQFRHAHLEGAIFGEYNGVGRLKGACDLRGADLSRAYLDGARFENVIIDGDTKFGEGLEGSPSATFGTVNSKTMTRAQINEKLAAAQAVIDAWQQNNADSGTS